MLKKRRRKKNFLNLSHVIKKMEAHNGKCWCWWWWASSLWFFVFHFLNINDNSVMRALMLLLLLWRNTIFTSTFIFFFIFPQFLIYSYNCCYCCLQERVRLHYNKNLCGGKIEMEMNNFLPHTYTHKRNKKKNFSCTYDFIIHLSRTYNYGDYPLLLSHPSFSTTPPLIRFHILFQLIENRKDNYCYYHHRYAKESFFIIFEITSTCHRLFYSCFKYEMSGSNQWYPFHF